MFFILVRKQCTYYPLNVTPINYNTLHTTMTNDGNQVCMFQLCNSFMIIYKITKNIMQLEDDENLIESIEVYLKSVRTNVNTRNLQREVELELVVSIYKCRVCTV